MASSSETDTDIITSFRSFLQDWMLHQQTYLDELLAADVSGAGDEHRHRDLINRVVSHYQHYYSQKSTVGNQNVLLLFSAPWLTSLEHAFLWITGFRPSLAVQLARRDAADLSEEQTAEMEDLAARTRSEEKSLNDEVARVQESVAGPAVLGVARRCGAEDAVEIIKASMEAVVKRADVLREATALKVVEILTPVQTVKFLAVAARFQLEVHRSGLQRVITRGG